MGRNHAQAFIAKHKRSMDGRLREGKALRRKLEAPQEGSHPWGLSFRTTLALYPEKILENTIPATIA